MKSSHLHKSTCKNVKKCSQAGVMLVGGVCGLTFFRCQTSHLGKVANKDSCLLGKTTSLPGEASASSQFLSLPYVEFQRTLPPWTSDRLSPLIKVTLKSSVPPILLLGRKNHLRLCILSIVPTGNHRNMLTIVRFHCLFSNESISTWLSILSKLPRKCLCVCTEATLAAGVCLFTSSGTIVSCVSGLILCVLLHLLHRYYSVKSCCVFPWKGSYFISSFCLGLNVSDALWAIIICFNHPVESN